MQKLKVKQKYIRRFTQTQRITHLFVIVSFLTLALTGMILKFAYMDWAKFLAKLIGGAYVAGIFHRYCSSYYFWLLYLSCCFIVQNKKIERNLKLSKLYFWK